MNGKITLLTIAVTAIGIFLLPNALSLFSGQHTFDKAGNTTICAKCHSDVFSEIQSSAYHKSLIVGSECKGCHTSTTISSSLIPLGNGSGNVTSDYDVGVNLTTGNFTQANGTNITFSQVHAAITVECVGCHYAVKFTDDAHKSFYDNTSSNEWLNGANEACVGCHTKTAVSMTWIRKGGYNYSYEFNSSSGILTFNNTDVITTTNNTEY